MFGKDSKKSSWSIRSTLNGPITGLCLIFGLNADSFCPSAAAGLQSNVQFKGFLTDRPQKVIKHRSPTGLCFITPFIFSLFSSVFSVWGSRLNLSERQQEAVSNYEAKGV